MGDVLLNAIKKPLIDHRREYEELFQYLGWSKTDLDLFYLYIKIGHSKHVLKILYLFSGLWQYFDMNCFFIVVYVLCFLFHLQPVFYVAYFLKI